VEPGVWDGCGVGCSEVGTVELEEVRSELDDRDRGESGLMSPYAITRFLSFP